MIKKLSIALLCALSLNAFAAIDIDDELINDTRKGSFHRDTGKPLDGDYAITDYRHSITHQHYTNGLRNGPFKIYDHKGQLANEGSFKDGVMDGLWTSYIDGKVFTTENYTNGRLEGKRTEYHRNGKVKYVSTHVNSKMEGLVESFYENGQLENRHTIHNGNDEGLYEAYHENGQLRFKYIATKGKHPDGEFTSYHADGSVYLTEFYKNGELEGESKCFYENHKLRCHEFYKNGKYHGTVKAYREDETLGTSIEYRDGKGNGLAQFYDKTGKLYCEATYKNDYLEGKAKKYVNGKPIAADNCN